MKKLKIEDKNVVLTNAADRALPATEEYDAHLIIKDGKIVKNHTDFSKDEIDNIIEDNIHDAVHPINQGQL